MLCQKDLPVVAEEKSFTLFVFVLLYHTVRCYLGGGNDESCKSLGDFVFGAVDWRSLKHLRKGVKLRNVCIEFKLKSKECCCTGS